MKKTASPLSGRQYACLATLVLYTSGLSFLMHASRRDKHAAYLVSTSVFLAEAIKLAVSFSMEYCRVLRQARYIRISSSDAAERGALMSPTLEKREMIEERESVEDDNSAADATVLSTVQEVLRLIASSDCWKLGIPALLYVLQSMLQLFSLTILSPATYQNLTQVKILTASLLSAWLLKRCYTIRQWVSVCVLCLGVAILSTNKITKVHHPDLADPTTSTQHHLSLCLHDHALRLVRQDSAKLMGILSVLLACSFGTGGAVVMEMVIKDNRASIWVRNAQLSFFSLLASGCVILYDCDRLGRFYPMQHFGLMAWIVVLARSIAGFLIAYVLQQCDAVLKGIATSLAMILSLFIETCFLGHVTSLTSVFGASLVVFSSITYVQYQA